MTLGAVVGLVVSVGAGLDEGDWSLLAVPLVAVVVGVPLGLVHALLWVRPLRVSYEVRGGVLVARRGKRVVREWPCKDVVSVVISEGVGVGWEEVLSSNWLSYNPLLPFSSIDVRSENRWDPQAGEHGIPTIVVWGGENARRANQLLNAALRSAAVPELGS